ncbi:Hypothetical predicted protein [Podarcis lilfordi]|uniref:Uncharacterized protein n=1 Tax=Podarcis lilfordi TaxID=74358 RepID=A0AA35KH65_9SAUR|nr:Hypothetical predicted protein [Podarcis lilfordi]
MQSSQRFRQPRCHWRTLPVTRQKSGGRSLEPEKRRLKPLLSLSSEVLWRKKKRRRTTTTTGRPAWLVGGGGAGGEASFRNCQVLEEITTDWPLKG